MHSCSGEFDDDSSSSSSSGDGEGGLCRSYYIVEIVVQLLLALGIVVVMWTQVKRMDAKAEGSGKGRGDVVGMRLKKAAYVLAIIASLVRVIRCFVVFSSYYSQALTVYLVFLPFLLLNTSFSLMLMIWIRVLTYTVPYSIRFLQAMWVLMICMDCLQYGLVLGGGLTISSFRNVECQVILASFAVLFAMMIFSIGRKITSIDRKKEEIRHKNILDNPFTQGSWRLYTVGTCITLILICFATVFIMHKASDNVHNFIIKKYILIIVEISRVVIIVMFLHKSKKTKTHVNATSINADPSVDRI